MVERFPSSKFHLKLAPMALAILEVLVNLAESPKHKLALVKAAVGLLFITKLLVIESLQPFAVVTTSFTLYVQALAY